MSAKIEYIPGERVGNCQYVREIDPSVHPSGRRSRRAIFVCLECDNHTEFEALINNVKSYAVNTCGCVNRDILIERNYKHGLSYSFLHSRWKNIKGRCLNPNHQDYKYYGGRGITICDEWRDDFKAFYNHVVNLPHYGEPGMTIDRENNNEGYKPGNVRWVDMKTQRGNQRKRIK